MDFYRQITATVYFAGISLVSHFISRRAVAEWSWNGIKRTTWIRLCVLCVLIDSWLFLFASGLLTLSMDLEKTFPACSAAIFACICFYTTSKMFLYSFLIEKVHVVWSPIGQSRFQSPLYRACFAFFLVYLGVMILAVIGRIHILEDDVCIIGLKPFAALGLLIYDCLMNFVLTGLFLWPLLKRNLRNPKIKRMVSRTLIASVVALTTSTVNILVLAILHGKEIGWICLISCSGDVLVNAIALYYATSVNSNGDKYTVMTLDQDASPDAPGLKTGSSGLPLRSRDWSASMASTAVQHTMGRVVSTGSHYGTDFKGEYPSFTTAHQDISPSPASIPGPAKDRRLSDYQPRLPAVPPSIRSSSSRRSMTPSLMSQDSYQPTLTGEDEIIRAAFSDERRRDVEDTMWDRTGLPNNSDVQQQQPRTLARA